MDDKNLDYKELQEEAKALGLKHVGVSYSQLKREIAEAKTTEVPGKTPKVNSDETPEEAPKPKRKKKVNVAIIRDKGKQEIRRYTLEIHGKNFDKFAKEFIKERECTVEFVEIKKSTACPNCGHALD